MLTIFKDFFSFITGKTALNVFRKNNVLWIASGYILLFSSAAILILLKGVLLKQNILSSTLGNGSVDQWISESSLLTFVLQVGLLAPIMEEFAFRGVLLNKKKLVAASFVFLGYLLACKINYIKFYSISIASTLAFVLALLIVIILYKKVIPLIMSFTTKNVKWLIYLSSICFALWHYNNFDFTNANIFTMVFTFFPFFFHGLIYCWLSNRKGLQASLILHFINNALPVLIAIFKYKF
jgi:membrane protease YdiL (CAAX protease family)